MAPCSQKPAGKDSQNARHNGWRVHETLQGTKLVRLRAKRARSDCGLLGANDTGTSKDERKLRWLRFKNQAEAREKMTSPKFYNCAICRKRSPWNKDWRAWSSWLMEETIPGDVPTLCSDDCQNKFDAKRKSGTIQVPMVKPRGYHYRIVGKRVGY